MTDTPWEPPLAGNEVEQLLGALDRLRATFLWKADGLDSIGLRTTVGASILTLGGLLKHLAFVEEYTTTVKMTGEPLGEPWASEDWDHPDWSITSASLDTPSGLYERYQMSVERSRQRLDQRAGRRRADPACLGR